jgi:hypothetical protein
VAAKAGPSRTPTVTRIDLTPTIIEVPPTPPPSFDRYGAWDGAVAEEVSFVRGEANPVGLVEKLQSMVDVPGLESKAKLYYAIAYVDLVVDNGTPSRSILESWPTYKLYLIDYNDNVGVRENNRAQFVIRFFRDAKIRNFADARMLYSKIPDLSYMDQYPGLLVPVVKRYVLDNSAVDVSLTASILPGTTIRILRDQLNYLDLARIALNDPIFLGRLIQFLARNDMPSSGNTMAPYSALLLLNTILKEYLIEQDIKQEQSGTEQEEESVKAEEGQQRVLLPYYEQAEEITNKVARLSPAQAAKVSVVVKWLSSPLWFPSLSPGEGGGVEWRTALIPSQARYYDAEGRAIHVRTYKVEGIDIGFVQRFNIQLIMAYSRPGQYPDMFYDIDMSDIDEESLLDTILQSEDEELGYLSDPERAFEE